MFILAVGSITNLAREFFVSIDEGVFWLFEKILVNVFNLAGVTIFDEKLINEVLNRIYVILGLFILFRLAFSIITYIISPEALSDKDKGFGKIITRVIISLSLLVLTPSIFNYARKAQTLILPVIPRIIVGRNFTEGSINNIEQANLDSVAQAMSFQTYLAIFNYNDECNDPHDTIAGSEDATQASVRITKIGHVYNIINEVCKSPVNTSEKVYRYRYIPFVGTILGCFLVYMMIGITIDIAVRAVKLGLLQLLAPIPIMSYIDPKSSKDGAFANWVKNSISTYLDLFIRISVVYLIIFIFDALFQGDVLKENGVLVWVSILIGLFFFAKSAPKFIKDILGIKGDTSMFRDVMTGHGLAGLVGGIIGGSIASKKKGGSGIVGGLSGGLAAGKQFFVNALQGKSGGILKASQKAGEEAQKINTGWRGKMNRTAGESRARALGFSSERVERLERAAKLAERDLDTAKRRLQDAELHGSDEDKRQASNLYDQAYDKYRSTSGLHEKVKAARGSMVQKEPYEEAVARKRREAEKQFNQNYRAANNEARGYDSIARREKRNIGGLNSSVSSVDRQISRESERMTNLIDERYERGSLFENPNRGQIDNMRENIRDLERRRSELNSSIQDAEARRTAAEQNANEARGRAADLRRDKANNDDIL